MFTRMVAAVGITTAEARKIVLPRPWQMHQASQMSGTQWYLRGSLPYVEGMEWMSWISAGRARRYLWPTLLVLNFIARRRQ